MCLKYVVQFRLNLLQLLQKDYNLLTSEKKLKLRFLYMTVLDTLNNKHKTQQFTDQTKRLRNYRTVGIELSIHGDTKGPKI